MAVILRLLAMILPAKVKAKTEKDQEIGSALAAV